jgi:hypothetical protein
MHKGTQSITKASTGSKSGHIRTLINRHASPANEPPMSTSLIEADEFMDMSLVDNNGDEIPAPCVSGIRVKPKAKRYQNSVGVTSRLPTYITDALLGSSSADLDQVSRGLFRWSLVFGGQRSFSGVRVCSLWGN